MLKMKNKKNIWLMSGFGNNLLKILAYLKLINDGYEVYLNNNLIKHNFATKLLDWKIHSP